MANESNPGDVLLVEAELRRLMPVASLEALCLRSAKSFLPRRDDAAPIIAAFLKECLAKRIPTALLRVGDGEGNALALTHGEVSPVYLDSFNAKFFSQVGMTLGEDEAVALCGQIRHALSAADCIGFRAFDAARPEIETISGALATGKVGSAIGIIHGQSFLQDELSSGHFCEKIVTSMWVHLALIPHIDGIMEAAPSVIVITGRAQLEPLFEARLGKRLRAFIAVRPHGYRPSSDADSHYRGTFPVVLDALRANLRGTLVIVGAGFLGKLYCEAAKASGAVALDFGSAFDILAGMSTRPVHRRLDINALRWM